jgi:hypothetical protein
VGPNVVRARPLLDNQRVMPPEVMNPVTVPENVTTPSGLVKVLQPPEVIENGRLRGGIC